MGLQIKDPTNPLELLENANLFLQSFQQTPGAVACPYSVQLAPLSIANGVAPPNAADLQHAQDVLMYCAKRRSGILDQLNLLDYMNDNQTKFDTSSGAKWDAVTAAIQTFQDDLDIVASCASNAINHPKDAPMPSDFAKEKGKTFPSGKFPDILPAPKGGDATVNVPDFSGCKSGADCLTVAADKVKLAYERVAPQAAFRVIDTRPPKGTPVPEGSIVTIVCPATDWTKVKLIEVNDWKRINTRAVAQALERSR